MVAGAYVKVVQKGKKYFKQGGGQKLWFDIQKDGKGYFVISKIEGVKNPEQFQIKVNELLRKWRAIRIARAILLQKTFRKSGVRHARGGIVFYLKIKGICYTAEPCDREKINKLEREKRQEEINGCKLQPNGNIDYCSKCPFIECKNHPRHQKLKKPRRRKR